jgi:hypothetical protein
MLTHFDNEQCIVAAAQAGDSDAFITLLNHYSRHIYRLGFSVTGNHLAAKSLRNQKRPSFLNMKMMRIETYSRQRDLMFHTTITILFTYCLS